MAEQYLPDTFGAMTGAFNAGRLMKAQNKAEADKKQLEGLSAGVFAGDPNATQQAYAIDPATAKLYGEGADRLGLQLHNIANQITQLQASGNEQGAAMLYQQAAPMIRQRFPNAPAQYDPVALKPALDAVVSMTAGLGTKADLPNSYQEYQLAQNDPKYGAFVAGQQPTQLSQIDYTDPTTGQTGKLQVQWNPRTKQMTDLQGNPVGGAPQGAQPQQQAAPTPQTAQTATATDGSPINTYAAIAADGSQIRLDSSMPANVRASILANPGAAATNGQTVDAPPQYLPPQGGQAAPQPRMGFKADKVDPSEVGKRVQALADMRAQKIPVSDNEATFFIKNGKMPGAGGAADAQTWNDGLSPVDSALVKGIAAYDVLPSSLGRSQNRAELIARATMLNPEYSESNAQAIYAYKKNAAGSSPTSVGAQSNAANTALHHLGTMMQVNAQLSDPTGFQLGNKVVNAVRGQTSPTLIKWNQAKAFVSQEMAKLVAGKAATEQEINDIMAPLDANGTQEQRNAAISQASQFLYGRISALEKTRNDVLGGMAPQTSMMGNEAEKILAAGYKLDGKPAPDMLPASADAHGRSQQPAQQSAQRGPAVGSIEDGHRFKGGNPADPNSWEAVR